MARNTPMVPVSSSNRKKKNSLTCSVTERHEIRTHSTLKKVTKRTRKRLMPSTAM